MEHIGLKKTEGEVTLISCWPQFLNAIADRPREMQETWGNKPKKGGPCCGCWGGWIFRFIACCHSWCLSPRCKATCLQNIQGTKCHQHGHFMIYFCGMEIRSFRTLPSFCLPRSCSSESLEGQVCDSFGLRLGNHTFFGGCGSWFVGPRSWRVATLSMKDPSVLQLFMGNPRTKWRFLDGKIMENHQTTSWWIFRCEVVIPVGYDQRSSKIKNNETRGGKEVFAGDPAVSWNWRMQRDKMYVPTSCFTVLLGCFIGCPFKKKRCLFLRGKCSPKKSVHFWRLLQALFATRTRTFHWLRLGTIPPSERDTQLLKGPTAVWALI